MKPKREKRVWQKHECHCLCALALEEALAALASAEQALRISRAAHDAQGCARESCQQPYDYQGIIAESARAVLAKYGKDSSTPRVGMRKGGEARTTKEHATPVTNGAAAARTHTAASEINHLNFLSGGSYEG